MPSPEKLPLIVRAAVPQTAFDPDAVDTEVFCVNVTPHAFTIFVLSESFITLDETTGDSAVTGPPPFTARLAPGELVRVSEVKGWEWDGAVGLRVTFVREKNSELQAPVAKAYDLKQSSADFTLPSGKTGRVIVPFK